MITMTCVNITSGATLSANFSTANLQKAAIAVPSLSSALTMFVRIGADTTTTYRARVDTGSFVALVSSGAVSFVLPSAVIGY